MSRILVTGINYAPENIGTGKYTGITGGGPWNGSPNGVHGGWVTVQRLDYKLP